MVRVVLLKNAFGGKIGGEFEESEVRRNKRALDGT